ncbi:MAG: hypothetical protein HY319_04255 [Armatimonadetes bacterium]|nr:hypothetical protein [Armatimonadota bacterium]
MGRRLRGRGIALVLVLLVGLVMITLLKSLVISSRHGVFRALDEQDRCASLYLVEAALADALTRLEDDPAWIEGFDAKPMPRQRGTYSLVFHSGGGPPAAGESVNNLTGPEAVDGSQGEDSVPPYTAELLVRVQVGKVDRTVAVVVGRGEPPIYPSAMMASRNVVLRGDVDIDGVKSLSTYEPTPAGIHSNRPDDTAPIIQWQGEDGESARISGEVSVVSPHPGAIDFGSDPGSFEVEGGFTGGASAKVIPDQDIGAIVAANRSHPKPTVVPLGTTQLLAGKYFQDGNMAIEGDLALDNTSLYVEGNLVVNGSISGTGSIYCTGETHFKGDSRVHTTNDNGVAVFSQGSVYLEGFDGTEYLETMAANDDQARLYLKDIRSTLQDLQNLFGSSAPDELVRGGSKAIPPDLMRTVLGKNTDAIPTWQDRTRDATGKLAAKLEASPPGETRDFLLTRLDTMQHVFADDDGTSNNLPPLPQVIPDWEAGTYQEYGYLDAILWDRRTDLVPRLTNLIGVLDYDHLGTSHFQGILYSNGFIHASHDVSVVGALWVNDNRTQGPQTVNGRELMPGDIYLEKGVSLTLNEEYVKSGGGYNGAAPLAVRSWVER